MSAKLNNLTISSIVRDTTNFAVAKEPIVNDVSGFSESIVSKLTTLFNTTGLRTGRFTDAPKAKFSLDLFNHLKLDTLEIDDFSIFAKGLGRILADELNTNQAKQAKDGFLLIYDYSVENNDTEDKYLCVVFLHRMNGVNISEKLTLEDIEQINIDSLNLGARISLQAFGKEEDDLDERSILFKIGRGSEVRVYFQNFIGCDEPSDAKFESANLLRAIEFVCKKIQLNEEDSLSITDKVSSYCKGLIQNGEHQAELKNLASYAFTNAEHAEIFIQIAQETYKLSEYVGLDKSVINKYGDIIAKTDKYRFTIKKSAIHDAVKWDSNTEELTISQLPEETKQQLNNLFSR
ncbi:nucleoid-associated protein [Photobacterium aquimaris]|uniref:Nucleoid-associated protein n=1 Tax=Photobacterium aquimaris TaxID=512643 RepID=A0A2T3HU59_9GAMM|nr:nucleoid-associated protein [Photobacterium aquimaris]OBU19964.1 hypothetical protein AYY21_18325 [Photobacterium aquimaris]PQJ36874.1 hypothetical protein BTN98_18980 [Photobacterium aquimaris]PST99719.1 nucleoid-associated protein [Photobacterium aquimaris]